MGNDLVDACVKGSLQQVTLCDTASTLLTIVALETQPKPEGNIQVCARTEALGMIPSEQELGEIIS